MLIVFQGTKNSDRKAGAAMALTAASEALKTGKKVLIMSLLDYAEGQNLEDFVFEKVKETENEKNLSILTNRFNYQAVGMDAALRKADTGVFTKRDIDNYVRGIFRNKNAFDILDTSRQANFEQSLSQEKRWTSIQKILKAADNIYDYIFAYIGYTNVDAVEKMDNQASKIIVVANHGKRREFAEPTEKAIHDGKRADSAVIIYNHEPASIWNLKILKKAYDIQTVFPFIHNYQFDDAKDSGEIPRFAATNRGNEKTNINKDFMKEVIALTDFIDGKQEENENILKEEVLRHIGAIDETPNITGKITDTETTEGSVRGGLFGKPKYYKSVKVTLDGQTDNDEEEDTVYNDGFRESERRENRNKNFSTEDEPKEDKDNEEDVSSQGMSEEKLKKMDAFFDDDEEETEENKKFFDDDTSNDEKEEDVSAGNEDDEDDDMDQLLMDSFE